MKAHLLIAALLTSFAHSQPFPPTPNLNELVAAVAKDRKLHAPCYAESPTPSATPQVMQIARSVELPVLERLAAAPVSTIPPRPDTSRVGPVSLRSLVAFKPGKPSELLAASKVKEIPSIAPMAVDPFMLKVESIWSKPHGQWMNQLLKDIQAAKAAGDTEAYNTLTARYAAWAEKYLRRETPPDD